MNKFVITQITCKIWLNSCLRKKTILDNRFKKTLSKQKWPSSKSSTTKIATFCPFPWNSNTTCHWSKAKFHNKTTAIWDNRIFHKNCTTSLQKLLSRLSSHSILKIIRQCMELNPPIKYRSSTIIHPKIQETRISISNKISEAYKTRIIWWNHQHQARFMFKFIWLSQKRNSLSNYPILFPVKNSLKLSSSSWLKTTFPIQPKRII